MDGYEPTGKEILGDIFSKERMGKLYNDALEFGRGFGTGLWYTLQFPYNVPTQVRKYNEGESLIHKCAKKRNANVKMLDKWDKVIEENVSSEYKMGGNAFIQNNEAWKGGLEIGAGLGAGIGLLEGMAYTLTLASAANEYKWKILAPIAAANAISMAYEIGMGVYKNSRHRVIEKKEKL